MGRKDSMDSLDGRDSIDLTSVIAEFPHNDDYPHQIPVKKLIETFESCAAANLNSTTGSTASSSAASSDGGMKVYLRIRPTKTPESTITVENEFSIVTTAPECSKRALYTKTESRHYVSQLMIHQYSFILLISICLLSLTLIYFHRFFLVFLTNTLNKLKSLNILLCH